MSENKWDLKQVGGGAGAAAVALFLMQGQGIDLMNKSTNAQTQVVIEKTIANAQRIENLEDNLKALTDKIDAGFDSMENKLQDQVRQIVNVTSSRMEDRYTKTEHESYAKSVEDRLEILKEHIKDIKEQVEKLQARK